MFLDYLTVNHHLSANAGQPERQIEQVMQAQWNQTFKDHAVEQRSHVARFFHHSTQVTDTCLYVRPDKK